MKCLSSPSYPFDVSQKMLAVPGMMPVSTHGGVRESITITDASPSFVFLRTMQHFEFSYGFHARHQLTRLKAE